MAAPMSRTGFLACALALAVAAGYGWHAREQRNAAIPLEVFDRVVITPPLQVLLAGGDRYLAANLEAIRGIALPSDSPNAAEDNLLFTARARHSIAQLNPCHEDNYYLANALLTWGGAARYGNEVLRLATECRFWDEFPPFFYGFNLYYFEKDIEGAVRALDKAAARSKTNAASLKKLAIMLSAEKFSDDDAALNYLKGEHRQARDAKLREMLTKRIARLEGLIALRQAQKAYEQRFGQPLTNPRALIDAGILQAFPADPLNIGYEFHAGRFRMREMKIAGMEPPQK